ncbi:isoamyl acetate-hydrolyzing esterase 1 homolog [Dermacentor andersoni]|uniref:isoamyl acetate-hydrolyzing esterase 1 homolog n=1 Tax=Dermacentor andersoni TaxID=34620 RepID=UPI003B3BBDF6
MSNATVGSSRVAWPRIYLFGDTLTQSAFNIGGWGSVIAECFSRRCDVLARGLCGYNTRAWRHALPLVLGPDDARSVAALVLMLGTSDSADPRDPEATHVPLDEYADNVAHMLDYIKACGISYGKIILVTPPPIDEQLWLAHSKRRGRNAIRTSAAVTKYAKACAMVGLGRGVKVVDAHSEFLNDAHWSRLLSDGVNLSPAGSHKLTAVLLPVLREVVGGAPRLFPDFYDLDLDKPEDTISAWASETCGCARL